MHTYSLSKLNPAFTIWGSEAKMSAEILKVTLKEPMPVRLLELEVTDENGLSLYKIPLLPLLPEPDALTSEYPEIPVNKRFIFHNFLKITIISESKEDFLVQITWV